MIDFDSARRRIAHCAVEGASLGRTVFPVGPFRACLDPSSDLVYLNYVVPVWALGSSEETLQHLTLLRDIFRANRRTLRFEFVDAIWPSLIEELQRFGLQQQARVPLMSCTPDSFHPQSAPCDIAFIDFHDEDAIREFMQVQRLSFGMDDLDILPAEIGQMQHQIENGFWICALARVASRPVACGTLIVTGDVCELAGVGTHPDFRRRRIASSLSSFLVRHHFAGSAESPLVWLSAADSTAQAVYETIGFQVIGDQLHYIES